MSFIVIIPARFFSLRLPGKPLVNISGKPMIIRVIERALLSDADRIIVATDHIDILKAIKVENMPVEVCLTRSDHESGTERLAEVITHYKFNDNQIIVNLQGDEPFMPPELINKVADDLSNFNINISTLATPISSSKDIYDTNVIKVVVNIYNFALYFSRSIIPWCIENKLFNQNQSFENIFLKHVGIYAYRVHFIRQYVNWRISPLEKTECLEQLRILWYGERIYVSIIKEFLHISVDTQTDLDRANLFFKQNSKY